MRVPSGCGLRRSGAIRAISVRGPPRAGVAAGAAVARTAGGVRLASLENRRDIAVLDTRARDAFFEGHLAGSLLTELDYQFCSIAGSYVVEGTPIYLVVDDARLDEAIRALIRVGLDRVVGYVTPETLADYGGSSATFARRRRST